MLGTVGQVLMMSRLLSKIGVVTPLVVGWIGFTTTVTALMVGMGMIGITTVVTALMVGVVTALVAGITMGGARMTTGDPCGDQAALRPKITRLTSLLQIETTPAVQSKVVARCRWVRSGCANDCRTCRCCRYGVARAPSGEGPSKDSYIFWVRPSR